MLSGRPCTRGVEGNAKVGNPSACDGHSQCLHETERIVAETGPLNHDAMTLKEYERKRDFSKTTEPGPKSAVSKTDRAIFVVQLHHASSRHFDFRLQVGDTLKSWAVPKGPSFDPAVKRLAVEVEDHPVSYANFEGEIREGYGKGHVDQFDKGVWTTVGDARAQLKKGHLQFELFGDRLKGGWHLVRSGKRKSSRPGS